MDRVFALFIVNKQAAYNIGAELRVSKDFFGFFPTEGEAREVGENQVVNDPSKVALIYKINRIIESKPAVLINKVVSDNGDLVAL